jgi:hypothetical protein
MCARWYRRPLCPGARNFEFCFLTPLLQTACPLTSQCVIYTEKLFGNRTNIGNTAGPTDLKRKVEGTWRRIPREKGQRGDGKHFPGW